MERIPRGKGGFQAGFLLGSVGGTWWLNRSLSINQIRLGKTRKKYGLPWICTGLTAASNKARPPPPEEPRSPRDGGAESTEQQQHAATTQTQQPTAAAATTAVSNAPQQPPRPSYSDVAKHATKNAASSVVTSSGNGGKSSSKQKSPGATRVVLLRDMRCYTDTACDAVPPCAATQRIWPQLKPGMCPH